MQEKHFEFVTHQPFASFDFRQLGFITGTVGNEIYTSSDSMTGWLTEISCEGMETGLQSCSHGLWDHYDCSDEVFNAVLCGI